MSQLVLHYAPDNASLPVRLTLEQLGLPYRTALVDRARRAQQSDAYRRINPAGRIPALETPHGPIFETAAILLWLADTHGALAPALHAPGRGRFLTWLFFTSNTLHAGLRRSFYPEAYGSDSADIRRAAQAETAQNLALIEAEAATQPVWLGGDAPGVLDIYLAALLRWCAIYPAGDTGWFRLTDYPALKRIASRVEALPATAAAQMAEGLGPSPFTAPRPPAPPEGSAL